MALPEVGSFDWGDALNTWLQVEHNSDGTHNLGESSVVAARMYLASDDTIAEDTAVLIELDTDSFDEDGITDTSNHKIVPGEEGYYLATGIVRFASLTTDKNYGAIIYKNGAEYSRAFYHASFTGQLTAIVHALLYMNGSSDYVQLYGQANTGDAGTITIKGGASSTVLSLMKLGV